MRRAEPAQHIEAADRGQHHIQDHDLKTMPLQCAQGFAAIMHAFHLEALVGEIFGQHLAQLAIIVDQQYARLASAGLGGRGWCRGTHATDTVYLCAGTLRGPAGRAGPPRGEFAILHKPLAPP